MINAANFDELRRQITAQVRADERTLVDLRETIAPLQAHVRRIQRRTTTAVSLVATDGGENQVHFDPFLIDLVRVVDSSSNEYCLEVISPTTPLAEVEARQFGPGGAPVTPLGRMMDFFGVRELRHLSPMIESHNGRRPTNAGWIRAYRELVEWAVLFAIVREKDFGSDTVIIFDGLLRSLKFSGDLFPKLIAGIGDAIDHHRRSRRNIYVAGIAKRSKVLDRYRLAMGLEAVMTGTFASYVEVPRIIEQSVYRWSDYARGDDQVEPGTEINRFVGGKMFFVKFGSHRHDPVWPIDILQRQVAEAPVIFGSILADAENGFPVPLYPRCLQKAHEFAAMVDFDRIILQDTILASIRDVLGAEAPALDAYRVQDADPARRRYG